MASIFRGQFDLSIIGGGIIGLATARQVLMRHPKLKVCIIEKESELATHQSKRNSGVVHCGIYYKRKSLKSKFCINGARMIREYCQAKNLPYIKCGKLIVATDNDQIQTLHNLYSEATANDIQGIELVNQDQIEKIQPGCSKALEAIWSPNTAIVDWCKVALSYAADFERDGGTIFTDFPVYDLRDQPNDMISIHCANEDIITTKSLVNCAGVYSDYFVKITGNPLHPRVVPFRGNYFLLSDRLANSIKTNIYPVTNPKLPFLGVHVTPRIDGSVLLGPTALLVLSYERYNELSDLRMIHVYNILFQTGILRSIMNFDNLKAGLKEVRRHLSKNRFTKDVKLLLPDVMKSDLVDTDFCGIRAQLVNKDGGFVDDFFFESGLKTQFSKVLHVRNCPSPAATSSLAISERIANIIEDSYI